MQKIREWLAKTRASLSTWSGWLDLFSGMVGFVLSIDPFGLFAIGALLPEWLLPIYYITVFLVFFILPKLARKKDAEAADGSEAK